MATFSKFVRPETPRSGVITDRDLDIIDAILRYRFSPTSELARLVGGREDVNVKRLRKLWEAAVVNRFAFPGIRAHSEFIYYLDSMKALDLLVHHGRVQEIHPQMAEEIRLNREADYAGAAVRGQHMKLGFLQHSLMISRFHFMLEMSSRDPKNGVRLALWRHGSDLRGDKVEVPELTSRRVEGSNEYVWQEHDFKTVRLPVEPDALFTLRFADRSDPVHFFYEADRGSMPLADMMKKFRAYRAFIKRGLHKEAFGVHPIRAVLIETTDEPRARKLMDVVQSPSVLGTTRQSALFWLAISPLFTSSTNSSGLLYLTSPGIVLERLWALPERSLRSFADKDKLEG